MYPQVYGLIHFNDPMSLACQQHPVGDVVGFMEENPELGRQVDEMRVAFSQGTVHTTTTV